MVVATVSTAGNSLTTVMASMVSIFGEGTRILIPFALKLLASIALIDAMLKLFYDLMDDQFNPIGYMFRMIMKFGGWFFLIGHYPDLVNTWVEGCLWVGATAGQDPSIVALLKNPSAMIEQGFIIVNPLATTFKDVSGFGLTGGIMIMIANYIGFIICFFMMAFQMFATYLEFYIVSASAIMLLPFGAWEKTAFLSEKAISGVLASGIKLMVLSFIICALYPSIREFELSPTPTLEEAITLLGTVAAIALLTWKSHAIASGILGAVPSLSGGAVKSGATNVASGVASAGRAIANMTPAGRASNAANNTVKLATGKT